MVSFPYFQLSVLSFCEKTNNNSNPLECRITKVKGKKYKQASFPFYKKVDIMMPSNKDNDLLSAPSWYFSANENFENSRFEIEISEANTINSTPFKLAIKGDEILKLAENNTQIHKKQEIYKDNNYVVFGTTHKEKDGLVYLITANRVA